MESSLSRASFCYPRHASPQGMMHPVESLDGVMYNTNNPRPKITYYCPLTGDILSKSSVERAIENAVLKRYFTTDHALLSIEVGLYKVLYVSLDNSVRSMKEGLGLTEGFSQSYGGRRLEMICDLVNKIQADIVFFSEACRKCTNSDSSIVYWPQMKRIISRRTGLTFGCEQANNFSIPQMSFGIAMFYGPKLDCEGIISEQGVQLLPADSSKNFFGSGAVAVTLNTGHTVVGVHFPLDFVGKDEENNNYRTTKALIKLLEQYDNAVAIGDMNIVTGNIENCMRKALDSTCWNIARDYQSFFPSFFDIIPDDSRVPEITKLEAFDILEGKK